MKNESTVKGFTFSCLCFISLLREQEDSPKNCQPNKIYNSQFLFSLIADLHSKQHKKL